MNTYSKLIIGGAQFGLRYGISNSSGVFSNYQMASLLALAKSLNVKIIDTAYAYGDSEIRIGKLNLGDFQVITKLPKLNSSYEVKSFVDTYLKASLNRLNLESIYGYLLHYPNDLLSKSGPLIYERLRFWQACGKIGKIGISIHDFSVAKQIIDSYDIDIVQLPFNVFDRRVLKNGFLKLLKAQGIEVHVRSIFLQGLLLMVGKSRPNYFSRWDKLFVDWQTWLSGKKINATDACLQFVMQFPEIDNLVVGFDSVDQFMQISNQFNHSNFNGDFFTAHSEDLDLINPSNWKL